MNKVVITIAICICAFTGCSKQAPEGSKAPTEVAVVTSGTLFAVPAETNPVYRIVSGSPEQEGYARYLRAKVIVPGGLSRTVLEANIRSASKTLYDKYQPTGMMVFAYKEGSDIEGEYTAGRCDFHPKTKEKNDPTLEVSDFTADFDLVEDYFSSGVAEPTSTGDAKLDKTMGIDHAAWREVHKKYTEPDRKKIYLEIGEVDDLATAKAEKKYPDNTGNGKDAMIKTIGKRNQLEEDLAKLYETAYAKKHKMTYAEVQAIRYEGFSGHWPLPKTE